MMRRIATALALAAFSAAGAQDSLGVSTVPAGGEWERYLRVMQLTGDGPARAWTIRGFSPLELAPLMPSQLPAWLRHQVTRSRSTGKVEWTILPAVATGIVNTSMPYGFNDGPMWAGRGVTLSAQAGVAARFGVVSAAVAPIAFVSQNAGFAMAPTGFDGPLAFANVASPVTIDLPQRFGSGAYGRVDPGESYLRVDAGIVAFGLSSATEFFGPAIEHPVILGNNAGGFPHAFAGSSKPLDLKIAKVHGRIIWGKLEPSPYTPGGSRFAAAGVGTMTLPFAPGLELGAIRFFHAPWQGIGKGPYLRIFEGVFKSSVSSAENPSGDVPDDNQLASVFLRWASPGHGLEVYGEYGREDHSQYTRDFWEEPDHDAAVLLGVQRAWRREGGRALVFRAENLNTRISPLVMAAKQTPWYEHGILRAGHTVHGQALGSVGGFGGGATTIAIDRYTDAGRTTVRFDRILRAEYITANRLPEPGRADVQQALRVERARTHGPGTLTVGAGIVLELNRNFGGDAWNANLTATYRRVIR